jgi:hypothetical protein
VGLEGGLSLFLAMYLMGLVGVLLAIHVLQPGWEDPASISRTPTHQQRQKAARAPAAASPPMTIQASAARAL